MHATAGVLQGIRIGPWLFVVMIKDLQLLSDESFPIWKFADDTTVGDCTAIISKFTSARFQLHYTDNYNPLVLFWLLLASHEWQA